VELLTDQVRHAESPRWHDDRLWFSDVHDYKVKTIDATGRLETVAEAPQRPSGLGVMSDGRWLLVTSLDRRLNWMEDGALREACDLSELALGLTSDMVVDGRGRAYVSDTGFNHGAGEEHRLGQVLLFTEEGGPRVVAEDTNYANGVAVSPDGSRLFLAESFGERISAFDIEPDGSLTNRRVFADLGTLTDGICLDADGGMWVALPTSSEFVHLDAEGRPGTRLATPERMATACVLGGPERRTLFACSVHSTVENLSRGITRGVIESTDVAVPGAGWP
jgi:sugar lactone lactonase YvrE